MLAHTTKPELAKYYHSALFSSTKTRLLRSIKHGFLKTRPGLTEELIKKHLDGITNTTMVHLHTKRQEE